MVVTSYGGNKNPDKEIKNRDKTKKAPAIAVRLLKREKNQKMKTVTKKKKGMGKKKGRRKEQKRKRQTKEKKDRKEIQKGKREKQ